MQREDIHKGHRLSEGEHRQAGQIAASSILPGALCFTYRQDSATGRHAVVMSPDITTVLPRLSARTTPRPPLRSAAASAGAPGTGRYDAGAHVPLSYRDQSRGLGEHQTEHVQSRPRSPVRDLHRQAEGFPQNAAEGSFSETRFEPRGWQSAYFTLYGHFWSFCGSQSGVDFRVLTGNH